jgi:hypothetical protein
MKKSLLIIFLFLLGINLNAQSLKIYMPDWKTYRAEEVLNNSNFHLPYSPIYNSIRCSDPKLFENTNYTPRYEYPALMPLLIVADVPDGGKNVTWTIDNDNVRVISAPKGSQFLSKNHVVTPVASGKINIENPIRVIEHGGTCTWVMNCSTYNPNRTIKTSEIFKRERRGREKCVVKNKKFSIGKNQTYIVVLSTKKLVSTVTTNIVESGPVDKHFVSSKIRFINSRVLSWGDTTHCRPYALTISGGPVEAPVIIGSGQNNEVKIKFTVTNVGKTDIDLSKIVLQYKPTVEDWFEPFVLCGLGDGVLKTQESKDIVKTIKIRDNKVKGGIGNLSSVARIFYPSAPELGKKADFHVSYIRKEQADLAGIRTRLDFAGVSYQLSVINVTPALSKDKNTALLELRKIIDETGNHLTGGSESLFNGESWNDDVRVGSVVKIYYTLYANNKPAFKPVISLNK